VHHAHNETQEDRVILFCDIARPLRFGLPGLFNRAVAATLLAGGASPNLPGDPTGGVNKAFGGLYKVRLKAKALRAKSAFAYHAIKWGLVVLVIAGIWAI
jgi:beta-hydroxylase